ncbi:MAG: sugar transferase [Planctomycetota bacterium]
MSNAASGRRLMEDQPASFSGSSGLSVWQRIAKRCFDILASGVGLLVVSPVILIGWVAASISTRSNGFFIQQRVGKNGVLFPLIKLKSMRTVAGIETSVTTDDDVRITTTGRWLRKLKIDELPQLINVFLGHMSFVGPRPDVPGFADRLEGEDRIILSVRPGITGPATLAFRDEEDLLAGVDDPESYNREVIWPEKVRLNKQYIHDYTFRSDIAAIWQTIAGKK